MFQKYQKEVYLSMVFVSIAVVGGFIAYNIKREHGNGEGADNRGVSHSSHTLPESSFEKVSSSGYLGDTEKLYKSVIPTLDIHEVEMKDLKSRHAADPLMQKIHETHTPILERRADPNLESIGSAYEDIVADNGGKEEIVRKRNERTAMEEAEIARQIAEARAMEPEVLRRERNERTAMKEAEIARQIAEARAMEPEVLKRIRKERKENEKAEKRLRAERKRQRSLKQHNPSGGGTRKKRRTQRRKK